MIDFHLGIRVWRVLGLSVLATAVASPGWARDSQLWGKDGELWSPQSRLPDFSFAGYHCGNDPLPNIAVKVNVKDLGAKGDGETDDTAAFLKAIETVDKGAILIPAGRYKITDIIYIRKSGVVLKGEGPDKTVLYFPTPLQEIKPTKAATTEGLSVTAYSWSGGLVWVNGSDTSPNKWKNEQAKEIGKVKTKAERGGHVLELEAPANITPGERVEVVVTDPGDKSLINYLYGGQSGDAKKLGWARTPFVSRVTSVDGAKLTLERPLRTDIDPAWKPVVRRYQPRVSEVGIENLSFEFPAGEYGGHFSEPGFNPLAFDAVADCWARNIRILNGDNGPFLSGNFITIDGIVYEATRPADKAGQTGHHGVNLGTDNLFQNFDFRTKFVHDISVEASAGGVAAHGKGVDLCFDNHKRHPHANLFTDIYLGLGTRMFRSGGGGGLGRNAGAWTTFWGIRSAKPQNWPWATAEAGFGPDLMNLVGVETKAAPALDPAGRWFEPIPPGELSPVNLYEAQLKRRLTSRKP